MSTIGGYPGPQGLPPADDAAPEVGAASGGAAAAPVGRGAQGPSVSFTEEMHGTLVGPGLPAGRGENFRFHLTIDSGDMGKFTSSPDHLGDAKGWIDAPGLGGRLPIDKGEFRLFRQNPDSGVVEMLYDLTFRDKSGQAYLLHGVKYVHDDPGFDLWKDTSTLHTTLYRGETPDAPVAAEGTLKLTPGDFLKQLTTFRGRGGNLLENAKALGEFGGFFMGKLAEAYVAGKLPFFGGRP